MNFFQNILLQLLTLKILGYSNEKQIINLNTGLSTQKSDNRTCGPMITLNLWSGESPPIRKEFGPFCCNK